MQDAGIRVANLVYVDGVGGLVTCKEAPNNLIEIYAGWSDDKIRSIGAVTADDFRLYPGYPPGEHTDAIANANPDAPTADATPTPTPNTDAIADVAIAVPTADDAANDDAANDDTGLAAAMGGFELNDAAAKMVEMGFAFGGDGLDDAAASGANDLETNHPAQQGPSRSSESGGGESTVTTRRGRGGDRSSRSNHSHSRSRSKTRKGGGASFHSSSKAALKFSAPLLNAGLVDYEQTPDQTGHILFRTASFSGTRKPGENCALDSLNFCIGDSSLVKAPDLTETSKKLYGEKEMPSFEIMTQTMRRKHLPFELQRLKKFGQGPIALHSLLNKTEGMFLLNCQVKSDGELVGHFIGVDAWRRIIYDNDADETARYCQWDESDMATPEAAKDLFTQIGLVQLMHVYIVKVLASHKGETSYHGA